MNRILSAIGIVLVLIGTVFSLWSILETDPEDVQTAKYFDCQQKDFKKTKQKVIFGIVSMIIQK